MENEVLLQAIRNVIREEIKPIKEEVSGIKEEINEIKEEINEIKEEIKVINVRLDNIESTQKTILTFIKHADTEFLKIDKAVKDVDKIKYVINLENVK